MIYFLLYQTLGIKTASWSIIVVVLGIWIFEYIDVMCNCGISLNKISGYEKIKLTFDLQSIVQIQIFHNE